MGIVALAFAGADDVHQHAQTGIVSMTGCAFNFRHLICVRDAVPHRQIAEMAPFVKPAVTSVYAELEEQAKMDRFARFLRTVDLAAAKGVNAFVNVGPNSRARRGQSVFLR